LSPASLVRTRAKRAGLRPPWQVKRDLTKLLELARFTWEHDLHFFLKRAKADAHLYGSAREHRDPRGGPAAAVSRFAGRLGDLPRDLPNA